MFNRNRIPNNPRASVQHGVTHHACTAAALFADIIGFTRMSEIVPSAAMLELLEAFYEQATRIILHNGGRVERYDGDAVFATFGIAAKEQKSAADALRCAVELREAIAALSQRRVSDGHPSVHVGIGVDHGPVTVGSLNICGQINRTLHGDPINVARKLEALTHGFDFQVAASGDLIKAAIEEGVSQRYLNVMEVMAPHRLGGRSRLTHVWCLSSQRPEGCIEQPPLASATGINALHNV